MTEADWLACDDPKRMLYFLRGKASDRKLRLFAVACARRVWHLLRPKRVRRAVRVAERLAEGRATRPEAGSAEWALRQLVPSGIASIGVGVTAGDAFGAAWEASRAVCEQAFVCGEGVEAPRQAVLVRDIFGNPFRPASLGRACLTWGQGLAVAMAQEMYERGDFADLPVLADALEDAGCDSADLLTHLRSEGPHVRGCWAVDLVLAKG